MPASSTKIRLPYSPRITGFEMPGPVLNCVTPGMDDTASVTLKTAECSVPSSVSGSMWMLVFLTDSSFSALTTTSLSESPSMVSCAILNTGRKVHHTTLHRTKRLFCMMIRIDLTHSFPLNRFGFSGQGQITRAGEDSLR
ncbi:MAG: hypothetical protein R2813_14000 [Flavobacteriales bacterium]